MAKTAVIPRRAVFLIVYPDVIYRLYRINREARQIRIFSASLIFFRFEIGDSKVGGSMAFYRSRLLLLEHGGGFAVLRGCIHHVIDYSLTLAAAIFRQLADGAGGELVIGGLVGVGARGEKLLIPRAIWLIGGQRLEHEREVLGTIGQLDEDFLPGLIGGSGGEFLAQGFAEPFGQG